MNRAISSHESSCLINCKLLYASVHCCLIFVQSVPLARALTSDHRDCLVLASIVQQPEIQRLVSRGQIISADFPLLMDRHTTIILIL